MLYRSGGLCGVVSFYDIMRAVFSLKVSLSEIFANYAEEEKLDAAHEHNNTGHAWPAGDGIAEDQGLNDDYYNKYESNKAENYAEEGGES